MKSRCLSNKLKSCFFIFIILLVSMVGSTQAVCIEDEQTALLELKASLYELSNFYGVRNLLSTWVDHGNARCCDWERIKCDIPSGHVTHLSLSNIFGQRDPNFPSQLNRPLGLNYSLFLRFKELRSLDLSWNHIDGMTLGKGLEWLSSLKKLEILNLSTLYIQADLPLSFSFAALTSLKILDISYIYDYYPPPHDISELFALENLEVLDISGCSYYGTLQMPGGSDGVPALRKLKVLNAGYNQFNESLITSLRFLPSLKTVDLSSNKLLSTSFSSQALSHLTNLEKIDLGANNFNGIPSIQDCKSLMRLKKLKSISLSFNHFNKSIISCLSFLPSLEILDLSASLRQESSLSIDQELSLLGELKTLDLSYCGLQSLTLNELPNLYGLERLVLAGNNFNGTLPIKDLTYLHQLKVLDLSSNSFRGNIPSTIKLLSSLEVISFASNILNGSLFNNGLCELKNLRELDLNHNMFDGNLPECFSMLSSLRTFDISSNQFRGILLPSVIANLTSLEYIDFSHNKFEGSFAFSAFSSHNKLEVVAFISDNDKFVVETEEPVGWTPMFQLKVLMMSNCNINRANGSVVPTFLLHQHELSELDMSHNSLKGRFPNWLIKNNTMLDTLNLRNNSFDSNFSLENYRNPNIRKLDLSENRMRGTIPKDIQKFIPNITYFNLSRNSLHGVIPSFVGDLSTLETLDLSHNELSGEVPTGLFNNHPSLRQLELSNNNFHGEILSGILNFGYIDRLHLDSNSFTGEIGSIQSTFSLLSLLDISNNFFTGLLPSWISDMDDLQELVVRNNSFKGVFHCGKASFRFLDISENNFSGSIPSCLNFEWLEHLHLGSNRFTGPIPNSFRNLTQALTLDIGNNYLSGQIPKFLGELSNIRILLLRENNFSGSIPKELCKLNNASFIDLSSNILSGSIPSCLQNITGPSYQAFMQIGTDSYSYSGRSSTSILDRWYTMQDNEEKFEIQDEVLFTTKSFSRSYKGGILDIMSGLDLSSNKLTGDIPEELGSLTQILVLNLSHNRLSGRIPVKFSNLVNLESLDLSSNCLSENIPSELINLKSLAIFNVSFNNLSGRLPDMKAQFGTFTRESYIGNPLLYGPPLENKRITELPVTHRLSEDETNGNWYHVDMASFYGSFGAAWFVFILGFAAILYINPHWRRRWFDSVEECIFTCFYFLFDS